MVSGEEKGDNWSLDFSCCCAVVMALGSSSHSC